MRVRPLSSALAVALAAAVAAALCGAACAATVPDCRRVDTCSACVGADNCCWCEEVSYVCAIHVCTASGDVGGGGGGVGGGGGAARVLATASPPAICSLSVAGILTRASLARVMRRECIEIPVNVTKSYTDDGKTNAYVRTWRLLAAPPAARCFVVVGFVSLPPPPSPPLPLPPQRASFRRAIVVVQMRFFSHAIWPHCAHTVRRDDFDCIIRPSCRTLRHRTHIFCAIAAYF